MRKYYFLITGRFISPFSTKNMTVKSFSGHKIYQVSYKDYKSIKEALNALSIETSQGYALNAYDFLEIEKLIITLSKKQNEKTTLGSKRI